jgi:hypothetical protein
MTHRVSKELTGQPEGIVGHVFHIVESLVRLMGKEKLPVHEESHNADFWSRGSL